MLSLSNRAGHIVQAEIRAMTIECEKVEGINLAQGVCDTEIPLPASSAETRSARIVGESSTIRMRCTVSLLPNSEKMGLGIYRAYHGVS